MLASNLSNLRRSLIALLSAEAGGLLVRDVVLPRVVATSWLDQVLYAVSGADVLKAAWLHFLEQLDCRTHVHVLLWNSLFERQRGAASLGSVLDAFQALWEEAHVALLVSGLHDALVEERRERGNLWVCGSLAVHRLPLGSHGVPSGSCLKDWASAATLMREIGSLN